MNLSLKIGYFGNLKWKKVPQRAVLGNIYLRTNKTLIHISFTYLTNGEKNLNHKKYSTITA
jgi:hypothetical protein